ncbi:alpha/beta hydrolase [Intrasporangium chromatireducens Q5-1]|uniref:Alpha/beta hydrolase n=1 Tax=Intrasporangium chromatireducens Q5-1 TaxID=584657 RepID=W9GFC1_9MICO|nr:alpha/beta hydrolase [Intrasporangium chromatireducens]EWT04770.1 alpha/beta hydrolase [Intrasporangium chromatireducens Q5-1]
MSPERRRNPLIGVGAALVGVAAGVAAGVVADRATKHRAAMFALDTRDTYDVVPDEERVVLTDDGVTLHVEIDEPTAEAAEAAARGLTAGGRADELPTIVLTHGYCLSLRCWVFQRRALKAAGYRVVSWDHRGHGKSGRGEPDSYVIERLARDLRTVIEQVAPTGDLVLVGHSMGGMTIMALGELDPELIRERVIGVGFVSTSPGGITLANGGRSATIGRLLLERLGPAVLTPLSERPDLWSWVRRSSATLEEFLVDQNSFASPVAASLVRFTADILLGTPLDVINDYLATFDGFDIRPALKYFRGVHVLVFNGKDDVLTPPQHSDLIVDGIPGAEHVLVNDAGHIIMLEHPDLLNAQLTQLIERAVRSRAEHLEVSQQPRVRRTVTNVAKERLYRAHAARPPRLPRAGQERRAGRGA